MKIRLNNRPEQIPLDSMSIEDIIKYKNFTFKLLVTKINNKLVNKDERKKSMVKDGDNVMIMHLISGG